MKIVFDNKAKIAGIGLVPWSRLGPERWFENYRIASLYGWDVADIPGAPKVVALADEVATLPKLPKLNTQSMLENTAFQDMLMREFKGYDFLTYKAIEPPTTLLKASGKFLHTNHELAIRLENKAAFRTMFHGDLPFPEFTIIERSFCTRDAAGLAAVLGGRQAAVIQDASLSGGKGTYIVRSLTDWQRALAAFARISTSNMIVVSSYIEQAHERSLQCVVTRYGVFVGPLQKQIVRHPLLSNMEVVEGDRFCGGEISADDALQGVYPTMRAYAMRVGERLHAMGYRGIFGLDCLVSGTGQVYVLEVNPRLTGMTPLLTMLYREGQDIPFYLLHVLELADIPYTIMDAAYDPVPVAGSLLMLHSPLTAPAAIREFPASGLYDMHGAFIRKDYRMATATPTAYALVQQYQSPASIVPPGGRLASVFTNRPVLTDLEQLSPETERLVNSLLKKIVLRSIAPQM